MFFDLLFLTLGLVFGSFVTAFSYRFIRGISISEGRSFCDKCKHQLGWLENIPLISFILQNGKCKHCRKKISIRYPMIEITSGLGFLLIYLYRASLPYNFIFCLILFVILMLIFITDIEHQIIPDEFVFTGILLSVLYFLLFTIHYSLRASSAYSLFTNLFFGFLCASFLMLVNISTRGRGMGLGDVKFAVLGGILAGSKLAILWLFLSFLTGAIVAIILILGGDARLKDKIAFGPFLVISIFLTFVFGEKLLLLVGL